VIRRDALFVPPRFVPNDALLAALGCDFTRDGWVVTSPGGATSVHGVWAAGNVANPRAQVITGGRRGISRRPRCQCQPRRRGRPRRRLQPGQAVLVNGASGGVGTFVVQIARALGGSVTGACSSRNTEVVASIGSVHVIDYTKQDFTAARQRYDVLIDIAGSRSLSATRRVLHRSGVRVGVGGPDKGRLVGPISRSARMVLLAPVVSQRTVFFLAQQNKADLTVLGELIGSGKVTPVIDRTYPLAEAADAVRYLEEGHARGKVVVTM
jgi:NADPH:quinone reductase-like Zn-dependent oxidoreductase